ncbi:putative Sin3 binding protein-domain-containing protein [Scheffersomyces amazonensis]|uniref:putative Sin3 binding protein-domain-containing protein n=1 Tax=Scheffersomyces amazonensis TaxID=1078765 RepID=UPI00315CD3D0
MSNIHALINDPSPTPTPPPPPLEPSITITSNNNNNNNDNIPPPFLPKHEENESSIPSPPSPVISSASTSKQTNKKLLSTSSPEGIQVAAKITPTRLANLLIRKGPLPIRHITHQLALEVPSFESLSLSKQRRLIMAAMEQTDTSNNVVFEKIGWGQWAVRKVDSDYIVTEGMESINSNISTANKNGATISSAITNNGEQISNEKLINVNDLRNKANLKLGWSKKQNATTNGHGITSKKNRRESITNNNKNLHNLKLPKEPKNSSIAIASDSDDEDDDDDIDDIDIDDMEQDDDDAIVAEEALSSLTPSSSSEDEEAEDDDDDALFPFDNDESKHKLTTKTSPPPIKFAKRVPIRISPPPSNNGERRRKSSSSITKPTSNHRYQIFNRSRLESFDGLDNYIVSSAKNSNVSINSPPPLLSSSPLNSWNGSGIIPASNSNYIHHDNSSSFIIEQSESVQSGRRKSSFNESHLRSTLSTSLPHPQQHTTSTTSPSIVTSTHQIPYENSHFANSTPSSIHSKLEHPVNHRHRHHSHSHASHDHSEDDTDEEDWATMGAETLRKNSITSLSKNKGTPRSSSAKPARSHSQSHSHHKIHRDQKHGTGRSRSGERLPLPPSDRDSNTIDTMMDVDDEQRLAAFALVDLRN